MKRFLVTSLFALAMMVVLAAVMPGQSIAAAPPAPPAPTANCSGVSASVNIEAIGATQSGTVTASGAWSVGGGASGAYIKYYIDSTLWQTEHKTGTSGPWEFEDEPVSVGLHTFTVYVYPKKDGAICWTHGDSASQPVTVPSPNPSVRITCVSIGYPVYECTGSVVKGGNAPFTPYWNFDGGSFYQYGTPGPGPWSRQYVCKTSSNYNIGFKVRDNLGYESNEAHTICNAPDW